MIEIFVDFETYKEITRRRLNEDMTPGDVVKQALGLSSKTKDQLINEINISENNRQYWLSNDVRFPLGTKLEHRFRDGTIVEAIIQEEGIFFNQTLYKGLSPAATAAAGCVTNGWKFWYIKEKDRLIQVDCLRDYNFINKSF